MYRRYGLSDGPAIALNSTLLFVVLLYVYPLKFLSTYLVDLWSGASETAARIQPSQIPDLLIIYGVGYVAVFTVFLLMHLYAYRKRHTVHLTRLELFDTRYEIQANLINIVAGLASMIVAAVGGVNSVGLAGFMYPLILFPTRAVHGALSGRRRRALERK